MTGNYYCVAPLKLILDSRLNESCIKLYMVIVNLCNVNGYCYASNEYLSKVIGKKRRQTQSLLKMLFESEYIYICYDRNDKMKTKRKIYINKEEEKFVNETLFDYDWLNDKEE